jgi:radical SAM superfamily enzyme YgiQ (UPF0313 family)
MSTAKDFNKRENQDKPGKILLVMAPFWPPLIPPMGIACLKSFLQHHGYSVTAIDLNVEQQFNKIYHRYFDELNACIPREKQGNFRNTGEDVLRNQMMAHIHYTRQEEYIELVKVLIAKSFFCTVADAVIDRLYRVITDFYTLLAEYFIYLLESEVPGVLGFSLFENTLAASLFAAELAKKRYPEIKIVVGGGVFAEHLALGSPNWELFGKKTPYIDKIIVGEGELLFLKWLQKQLPESQKIFTVKDVGDKSLDLAFAPLPDFSDFNMGYYPYLGSYTSRSCPFHCTFCSETRQWGRFRQKETSQVVEQLKRLYKEHSRQLFLMCDSLMNPIITHLAEGLLQEGVMVYWDGYLRADKCVCDIEKTLLWRRGGVYRARLGIESGSQRVLDLMGKKITPGQIKQAISSLAAVGIKTTTYWVIGYPGETEADFQETLDLLKALGNDIYEAWCSPLYYYPTAQVNFSQWGEKHMLLYPGETKEMLVLQTWVLNGDPSREETYERMYRFVEHCRLLGVPNPFTLEDINRADERWAKLHKNAVPPLVDFQESGKYISEARDVKQLYTVHYSLSESGDFGF